MPSPLSKPRLSALRFPSYVFRSILPHEFVFSAFLLITWLRLVARGHFVTLAALSFLACLLLTAGVLCWAHARPNPFRWRIRLLLYFPLMAASFYMLKPAMPLLDVPNADALLNSIDIALLGTNLSVGWQHVTHPLLTDVMMGGYLFYFPYLFGGPMTYCVRDLPRFRLLNIGLFTVMGVGYIGYTLWPAAGPYLYLQFAQQLTGGWLTALAAPLVETGGNGVDVFPSLHLAASLYLLGFDWRFNPHRFWWVLAPCLLLWASTIYLRYHYSVDLIAGALLAAVGWMVAAWWKRGESAQSSVLSESVSTPPATQIPNTAPFTEH